jgi:NADH-quinone oxidoreductase subunit A
MLSPPVVFLVLLGAAWALSWLCSRCAWRKRAHEGASRSAYACGEVLKSHMIQPDYSQFFPFAFFFTILHVVALVIATVPVETIETFAIAVVYLAGAVIGLCTLLRKR